MIGLHLQAVGAVVPLPWATTINDSMSPEPWAWVLGGPTTPFPAIFSGPGGLALSQRIRAGLAHAGLSPSLLGVLGPDGLSRAQISPLVVATSASSAEFEECAIFRAGALARSPLTVVAQSDRSVSCSPSSNRSLDARGALLSAYQEQMDQEMAADYLIRAAINETHLLGDVGDILTMRLTTDIDRFVADDLLTGVDWGILDVKVAARGIVYKALHVANALILHHVEYARLWPRLLHPPARMVILDTTVPQDITVHGVQAAFVAAVGSSATMSSSSAASSSASPARGSSSQSRATITAFVPDARRAVSVTPVLPLFPLARAPVGAPLVVGASPHPKVLRGGVLGRPYYQHAPCLRCGTPLPRHARICTGCRDQAVPDFLTARCWECA